MEKVPGPNVRPKPHPPQPSSQQGSQESPQAAAGVIIWSSCAQSARRWEQRLTRPGSGPVEVIDDPHALRSRLACRRPGQSPLVLVDFERPLSQVLAAGVPILPPETWPLLRSCPTVAVVRELAWKDVTLWLLCGARAFVWESSTDAQVRAALEAALEAAREGSVLQLDDLLRESRNRGCPQARGLSKAPLSPREQEILHLVCQGMSNAEMASRMFVTQNDIRHHLKNLYRKLGTRNRVHVLVLALSYGVVALQDLLDLLG